MILRKTTAALAVGGVLLTAVSCSTQLEGHSDPTSSRSSETSTGAATSKTSSDTSQATLATKNPCTFLNTQDKKSLGIQGEGKKEKVGTARTCGWDSGDIRYSIGIRTNAGLDDMNNDRGALQKVIVGNHESVKQKTDYGCGYYIGVTSSSRVDVLASNAIKPDCEAAKQLAELIEPKLPKS